MKPCIYCDVKIAKDVWIEELGMCLSCSNAFFDHVIDPYDPSTFPKNKTQAFG
jgi:hypothetical protein